jgi:hypothetical protein
MGEEISVKRLVVIIFMLFTFANGAYALPVCIGSWSASTWNNCQGTYTFADGSNYVGEYKDGKRNGQGTYTYGSNSEWAGDKYVGKYEDGKRHGQGTYTYANGNREIGEWQNDNLNGHATTYYANGNIDQEGIFKDGMFLYELKKQ